MSTLWITEYRQLSDTAFGNVQGQIAPLDHELTIQAITISGTSAQSAALNASTRYVRLRTDAACAIVAGASPTATSSNTPLDANAPEYFGCAGGLKIAAITI